MNKSEHDRAIQLLKQEFGPRWNLIAQELGTEGLRHQSW